MQLDFTHQVVLITGAAQGIGRAIASAFAAAGARVHISDIDEAGLAAVGLPAHPADLGDRQAAHRAVDEVVEAEQRLDILIHAAGGTRGQAGQPLENIDETAWRGIFAANCDAFMWLAQAAAPTMKTAGQGRIIAIASGAGLRVSLTGIQAYAAAKHALVGLTRQLSWELGPQGITVNAVAPGFIRSNPTTERQWQALGEAGQEQLIHSIHTRRLGSAEDIAAAVLFLASHQAGWISGQILSVDGGRS